MSIPAWVGRFNDVDQLQALGPAARQRLRYVLITHANDAVGHFGLDLLVRAPDWLGPAATRAAAVPGPSSGAARRPLSRPWST